MQFRQISFQANHQIPTLLGGTLQHLRLRVECIQQKNVKKPAALDLRQLIQEAQSRRVFALSGLQPLHR